MDIEAEECFEEEVEEAFEEANPYEYLDNEIWMELQLSSEETSESKLKKLLERIEYNFLKQNTRDLLEHTPPSGKNGEDTPPPHTLPFSQRVLPQEPHDRVQSVLKEKEERMETCYIKDECLIKPTIDATVIYEPLAQNLIIQEIDRWHDKLVATQRAEQRYHLVLLTQLLEVKRIQDIRSSMMTERMSLQDTELEAEPIKTSKKRRIAYKGEGLEKDAAALIIKEPE